MQAGDIVVSVDVYIDKEDEGGGPNDQRTTSYGVAEVLQGNASMSVELLDGGAAERLVVALVDE